nr:putative ribonuclease H-like domain-containing protein [Tanacetum cinerariifolium]
MPPKLDLSFTALDEFKPEVENNHVKSSEEETKLVRKNNDAPIIKEWVLDNEEEELTQPKIEKKTVRPNIVKKDLMKKMYSLVVIDDYSRFTWVFFLATKDETSGILKSFITRIENLVDHKVKVIRCDNVNEFKNREINKFCEMKGIMRQFSVAKISQQNGVAERRNKTLIEAARTMLADFKLPTTFYAEVVNTACYVKNIVLVVKPHNKTPYEFFHGRTPTLSFMRPFGCPITILNNKDHLGSGSDWQFVIDALTRTTNYEPIVADPKSSYNDGFKPSSDDGKKVDEDPSKRNECKDQEKEDNVNSTNNVNTVSSIVNLFGTNGVNVVGELPFDPDMPALDDVGTFDFSNKDDDVVADMNNLDTTIQVSPTLTTRIHKDHPLDQVIRDLQSATQTRNMTKNLEEHGFIEKEVYVCQPIGFKDPDFHDRVYKVEKHCMDYIKLLEHGQFWSTVVTKTINGEAQIHARVDGKKKMAPKRTTKSSLATTTTTTTLVTDAQLKALIDQGVARALAARYNQHFQELALLYVRMFFEESDKIERYIGGLPDMIHRSMVASKPKTMQKAIEKATELMDKKIRTFAEHQTENKRKQDDNNNQAHQQPLKKQGVAIAYTTGPGERKEYAVTLPLCNKCKFHHNGQCTVKCVNCKRVGHLTRDCRSSAGTNSHRNPTFYECRNQGHYRSDCLDLKNQDHGNQAGGTGAHRMVHALEGGETNQDLNDVDDDINA